jgi:hypothetical protein
VKAIFQSGDCLPSIFLTPETPEELEKLQVFAGHWMTVERHYSNKNTDAEKLSALEVVYAAGVEDIKPAEPAGHD